MFEITAEDTARLDDETLRAVVARLCEAELRQRGYGTVFVTWGGHQNAPDGGIDVRVALPAGSLIVGFVPRPAAGLQVKAQDMSAGEIVDEMCPKGIVRASIQQLADEAGAYIIVSSQGSITDTALTSRRDAMKTAIAGMRNAGALFLDFYDRTRIATWVRSHEGLVPWVRGLVGRTIPGWQSYGSWAYAPEAVSAAYLLDEKLRLYHATSAAPAGLSILEGIRELRNELSQPGHVVRLVGLSGVGKTRLVQALFDERLGQDPLDSTLAIYTNMADSPDPQPVALASNLVAGGRRQILVIDNCAGELHQRLSEVCRQPNSKLSVITIEYDIREDEPEGTSVFRLDTASPALIEQLIGRRFAHVSRIDAQTIAEFSGGNARIAIALAGTIGHRETIAGLTDDQLFQRLFLQRHVPNEALYRAAQVCSLVYSFDGEDVTALDGELARLGSLIGQTSQELYAHVAELERRDLVQRRSVWRAVLPHAIANRLAAVALQNIPYAAIQLQLLGPASKRLRTSFSRRLGYLHASKEAVAIVRQWLGVGGLLENVAGLDDDLRAMFANIAPVLPEQTLTAMEQTYAQQPAGGKTYLDLLRSLAYEPVLFERCAKLMAVLLAAETDEQAHASQVFASLFQLYLSGTQATIEQRANVTKGLLLSPDAQEQRLGIHALKALLEAWQFQAANNFDFGARPRDFGYLPQTAGDVRHWFREALKAADAVARSAQSCAPQARAVLAEQFRGLWTRAGIMDELGTVCRTINDASFWPQGWLAVRQTLDFDGKGMDERARAILVDLEQHLRPKSLVQQVRAIVFSARTYGVGLGDFEDHTSDDIGTRMERTEALAKELGKATAAQTAVLQELLPELVSKEGKLWSFGQGLVQNTDEPRRLWKDLVAAFSATDEPSRRVQILQGVLHALHEKDAALAGTLLDESIEDDTLAAWYPVLEVAADLDAQGLARIKQSLDVGKAPGHMYKYLAYGRARDGVPARELQELILRVAAAPSGYEAAVEILHQRLHAEKDRKVPLAPELIETGVALVRQIRFLKNQREDYQLGEIIKDCLTGGQGAIAATEVCARLKAAVSRYETYAFEHDDLVDGLFGAQPLAALEGLCGGDERELQRGIGILRNLHRKHPLGYVSDDELVAWCNKQPLIRYPAIADIIKFAVPSTNGSPQWTTTALRLLASAPDAAGVLRVFVNNFDTSDGTGSPTGIVEANAALLDQLDDYPAVSTAIVAEKQRLQTWIVQERQRETLADRARDERFE